MTCPACGRSDDSLTVTGVDHDAGTVSVSAPLSLAEVVRDPEDAVRFTVGQRITFRGGRSRWRRFADVWRAARMAWRRP